MYQNTFVHSWLYYVVSVNTVDQLSRQYQLHYFFMLFIFDMYKVNPVHYMV